MHDSQVVESQVWVFSGEGGDFPSGVFRTRESAEAWITKNKLSGVLTSYPLDVGVYDWAVSRSLFQPKRPEHESAQFIQTFSSAKQEHFHYEQGRISR
ncbi:DUF7710 domain-containing protein [Hyalangium sp.]|uniref:DUF7710 domain-containing protein n=1 Tax=Hyalangium sp. TaxID=2028555 RepID=UPI003BB88F99